MRTVVEGEFSDPVDVESGVPQGTVLGPLLFLCHINDLPDGVKSQVRLFADDCLLYRPIRSRKDHIILQEDLERLESWAAKWGMRFNAKKCYLLSIKNSSQNFYSLDNQVLKQVQENPYLGVTLSDDLKWGPQVRKTTKKANSVLYFLRRNLKRCPKSCKQLAYVSLVRSVLDYAAIVWDPYLAKDINSLERVQRKSVRFICNDYRSRHEGAVTNMLDNQGLKPLKHRREIQRLVFMYKIVEEKIPAIPPTDYFQKVRPKRDIKPKQFSDYVAENLVQKYATSNDRCFVMQQSNSQQLENSFFIRTVQSWNHLPQCAVHSETVEAFRASISSGYILVPLDQVPSLT